MNENSGRLELKPIEDVARLELGPKRIEEIIRHIDDAIEKIKSSGEVDKEEMMRDLEEAREKAQGLLSEYLKSPESKKSLEETIH
jgi:Sec-independent protein translocase protein TatA